MNDKLFIPNRIKVGYNERGDTYTGKLGYVIYYDAKGKLRKETSWNGWREKKLGDHEHDNVPTEGFVLNKDVGGTRHSYSSWHARMEKVRVFDPRGFEFEISIPNVLFILTNCTSTKGKGLEGQFVYAWAGTELVLLPVDCQEYRESNTFTAGLSGKVSTKDLAPGCTYLSKKRNELVYLGKFGWAERGYGNTFELRTGHVFHNPKAGKDSRWGDKEDNKFVLLSAGDLSAKTGDTPVDNYAELVNRFNRSEYTSIYSDVRVTPFHFKHDEFGRQYHDVQRVGVGFEQIDPNTYRMVKVNAISEVPKGTASYNHSYYRKFKGYGISASKIVSFGANGEITVKDDSKAKADKKLYTADEIAEKKLKTVKVTFKGNKQEYTLNA
jgi:hypothetical protein